MIRKWLSLSLSIVGLVVAGVVLACSPLGMTASAYWLAVGSGLHGARDWLHDLDVVSTRVAPSFPLPCAAFDFAIALFVLLGIGA